MIDALQVLRGLMVYENWDACSALIDPSLFADDVQRLALSEIDRYHRDISPGEDMDLDDLGRLLPGAPTTRALVTALRAAPELKKRMEAETLRVFAREASARRLGVLGAKHAEEKPEKRGRIVDEIFKAANQVVEIDERLSGADLSPSATLGAGGLDEEYSGRIPLGYAPTLTRHLDGGIPLGGLGIILAPTKGGKSLHLRNMAAAALREGYDVIDFTMELGAELLRKWYLAILTGIPLGELRGRMEEAQAAVRKVSGNLYIFDRSDRIPTIGEITATTKRLLRRKDYRNAKLVIVDYLDPQLIMSRAGKDTKGYEQLGDIAARLRVLARSEGVAVVTAQQVNRVGFYPRKDGTFPMLRWHHAADSSKPPKIADWVVVHQEKDSERMLVLLDLNRLGEGDQLLSFERWDGRMQFQEYRALVSYWPDRRSHV